MKILVPHPELLNQKHVLTCPPGNSDTYRVGEPSLSSDMRNERRGAQEQYGVGNRWLREFTSDGFSFW